METDVAARVRQAASTRTSPAVLHRLASDPNVTVRASLALNPALPPAVTEILAADRDERVRLILARSIAKLMPGVPPEVRSAVQQGAVANLTAIVAQAALRVRTSIAEAVQDLPDGPREIVLRLAHDPAVTISQPVIRFSPMLTQADLITLIASAPAPSTIASVAQRPGIDAAVADAVVGSADTTAITALLSNPTAQIREATLDALAAQSEDQAQWQELLIGRPKLPARTQRLLAEIVTGTLLQKLSERRDLEPRVKQQVSQVLEQSRPRPAPDMAPHAAYAHAEALRDAGALDDMALLDAMRRNAAIQATAMFAVRARVPAMTVEVAFRDRNAATIVALAWRGGLSAQTATVVQAALARLPPDLILRSGPGGTYPLSDAEMQQQLDALDLADTGPRRWVPRRLKPKASDA